MAQPSARSQRRLPNPRRVKIHRSYTVEEAAALLDVHKNTVREWMRNGLAGLTEQRPFLILGSTLSAYLTQRRQANKRPCKPGEIYCVRCRTPKSPAGRMADYQPLKPTSGNLVGICPSCDALMFRRVSLPRLAQIAGELDVRLPEALQHIVESRNASVNSDFRQD